MIPNPPYIGYHTILTEPGCSYSISGAGNPATFRNALNWRIDNAWHSGAELCYLTITHDEQRLVDYIGIAGHSLNGGMIRMDVFLDGEWRIAGLWNISTDDCLLLRPNPQLTKRWRLTFQAAHLRTVSMAICTLGASIPVASGLRAGFIPPPATQQVAIIDTTSQAGLPLGRSLRRQAGSLNLSLTDLPEDWMRDHWLPFVDHAIRHPFFLQWNRADFAHEVCLCWTKYTPPAANYSQPGFLNVDLPCRVLTEVPL